MVPIKWDSLHYFRVHFQGDLRHFFKHHAPIGAISKVLSGPMNAIRSIVRVGAALGKTALLETFTQAAERDRSLVQVMM